MHKKRGYQWPLLLLLVAASTKALGSEWVLIAEVPQAAYYFDKSAAVVKGDSRFMTMLVNFKVPVVGGGQMKSMINRLEFDCRLGRQRVLAGRAFLGHHGSGEPLEVAQELPWEPVAPDGIFRGILNIICSTR